MGINSRAETPTSTDPHAVREPVHTAQAALQGLRNARAALRGQYRAALEATDTARLLALRDRAAVLDVEIQVAAVQAARAELAALDAEETAIGAAVSQAIAAERDQQRGGGRGRTDEHDGAATLAARRVLELQQQRGGITSRKHEAHARLQAALAAAPGF